jgi:acetylornithine deacetylase/succinyl-diaminopimelate desuccinylase-like protein
MDLAANDSSFLVEAGIPALLLGPGDPEQAHTTDESLDLAELSDAIAVYAELALACVRSPI